MLVLDLGSAAGIESGITGPTPRLVLPGPMKAFSLGCCGSWVRDGWFDILDFWWRRLHGGLDLGRCPSAGMMAMIGKIYLRII